MLAFTILLFTTLLTASPISGPPAERGTVGVRGPVGCGENPKRVERLEITRPGVYENYLVDSNWAGGNRVKIMADDVTLRHCEIRNATGNGVGVFGRNVTIENCKIHHLLHSTFADQHDTHGLTGRWYNVTIRNCEIFYVSGDCIQFDPDRKSAGKLLIEIGLRFRRRTKVPNGRRPLSRLRESRRDGGRIVRRANAERLEVTRHAELYRSRRPAHTMLRSLPTNSR
jgi:hypothetical protein